MLTDSVIREMDAIERLITRAVRKSKDGKIDQGDFLNEAAGSMRYSMFTPMEVILLRPFPANHSNTTRRTSSGTFLPVEQ